MATANTDPLEDTQANVVRRYYSDLTKAIAPFPDLLLSLSNEFFQHSFINFYTKSSINRSGGLLGASMLLDHVMMKIEQSDQYLPLAMDVLRKEVALKDIVQKMDILIRSGYDVSIVPKWCYHGLSSLQYEILPVYRTIKHFHKHKQNNEELITDPFYTSKGGYKATLRVDPNGHGSAKGTHVSVFMCLVKGPNDDNLPFPINGIFTLQMLNWKEDHHHTEKSIKFDDSIPIECTEQVTRGERAGFWGINFLSHNDMASMNVLYEDMMCFKISYIPINIQIGCSPVPSWCDVMYSTLTTPPCTRTLYSYTAFKKTNRDWYSQPFYSTDNGYKLLLFVNFGESHLNLHVVLMKGDYDDTLSWPFNATITVQLLNWSSDSHHVEKTIDHHEAPLECRQKVVDGDTARGGWGHQFISHTKLQDTSDHTVTFINNDNICFRIIRVDILK